MKASLFHVTSCYSLLISYQALRDTKKRKPPIAVQQSAILEVKDISLKGTVSRYP